MVTWQAVIFLLGSGGLAVPQPHTCLGRELIYPAMSRGRVCQPSRIDSKWQDCAFRAGGTEIMVAGAAGVQREARKHGIAGSGFYVLSVDPTVNVRVVIDPEIEEPILWLGARDPLQPGCLYDNAYITIDAELLEFAPRRTALTPPSPAEQLKTVQDSLRLLGYDPGPSDGTMGPRTVAAIRAWRRDNRIAEDRPEATVLGLILLQSMEKQLEKIREQSREKNE